MPPLPAAVGCTGAAPLPAAGAPASCAGFAVFGITGVVEARGEPLSLGFVGVTGNAASCTSCAASMTMTGCMFGEFFPPAPAPTRAFAARGIHPSSPFSASPSPSEPAPASFGEESSVHAAAMIRKQSHKSFTRLSIGMRILLDQEFAPISRGVERYCSRQRKRR
jgi:hypothetical protein